MTNVYCLNGIHCSGKTSVANHLRGIGYHVLEECAETLIRNGINPFSEGNLSSDDFQRMVMRLELEREPELQDGTVVETYHPGNIAHCKLLAEDRTLEEYAQRFEEILSERGVIPIYLSISVEELEDRSDLFPEITPEIMQFYRQLEDMFFEVYDEFNLSYITINNGRPLEETVQEVRDLVA